MNFKCIQMLKCRVSVLLFLLQRQQIQCWRCLQVKTDLPYTIIKPCWRFHPDKWINEFITETHFPHSAWMQHYVGESVSHIMVLWGVQSQWEVMYFRAFISIFHLWNFRKDLRVWNHKIQKQKIQTCFLWLISYFLSTQCLHCETPHFDFLLILFICWCLQRNSQMHLLG